MTETKTVMCARCGKEKEAFERAPFPGAIGARVLDGTCKDPQARQFLTRNMEAFLFRHGQQDDVDTSKLGTITH
jgi:Fe-S cluster biosynthesis and repair protein YggX